MKATKIQLGRRKGINLIWRLSYLREWNKNKHKIEDYITGDFNVTISNETQEAILRQKGRDNFLYYQMFKTGLELK
jgi:hypothetical protein